MGLEPTTLGLGSRGSRAQPCTPPRLGPVVGPVASREVGRRRAQCPHTFDSSALAPTVAPDSCLLRAQILRSQDNGSVFELDLEAVLLGEVIEVGDRVGGALGGVPVREKHANRPL